MFNVLIDFKTFNIRMCSIFAKFDCPVSNNHHVSFYIIKDDQAKPDYLDDIELESIGKQIRQNILEKQLQFDTDINKLFCLCDIANAKQSGIIAYGD